MSNTTWTCLRCGGEAATTTRENEPFDDILPGVVLMNVEVTKCNQCGNREVAVPFMDDLMKAVARAVVDAGGRLTGDEVRFLRTFLELSGGEFAGLMDSTASTVSRWENNRTPVGRTADLLLRTSARAEAGETDESSMLDVVRDFAGKLDEKREKPMYRFRLVGEHWQVADAGIQYTDISHKGLGARAADAPPRKQPRRVGGASQRQAVTSSAAFSARPKGKGKHRPR